ncbi:TBC1 domain family member 2A [Folsomia candida]|uniref:TBC1 domain family member 2A n=1 Tax=Folsomia candida TaxID=158441 RepID=A0A226CXV3_FOLCA|nr:TBC1 domain family member 2A [Folsomia candida]
MTDLINSLKSFAYASGAINCDRRHSSGQLRIIPLLNLTGVGGGGGRTPNDNGFSQWRDAMRMVARLPGGLPVEFRLKLWENLSEKYLYEKGIPWSRVLAKSATPTSRDVEIADQIHKDLHRTGCTGFSGAKQVKLKSVLVAYGRWNPSVGYCQGFNMIGAMLLEMTGGDETLTLKVLIFLIEGVLPQGYFSGGLRGLAVDMAVFGEILRMRKPSLHAQLCRLQGGEEQPPLIDVFTMHWFLTLFIHCLPTPSVLRIWDLVLLEGSEVLLRTALVLWAAIETRILEVRSADQFYSVMGAVTKEMLEFGLMDPNSLVKCVVSVGPFPFPGLVALRQKHRALIQQDAPYKSFFLAKRELDNLKKHYAAIRHRQKATTIILKRSNSLFIPTTKKTTVSPRPKFRRGSSGASNAGNATTTATTPQQGAKGALTPSNNNKTNTRATQHNVINNNNRQGVMTVTNRNNVTNSNVNRHHGKMAQVTQTWDKTSSSSLASKAGKTFRRRRTLSSSSVATSSSSSTELCDSSDDEKSDRGEKTASSSSSSSEGVWSDSDNKWVKKKIKVKKGHKSQHQLSLEKWERLGPMTPLLGQGGQDSSKENETPPESDALATKSPKNEENFSIFEMGDLPSPSSPQSDPGATNGDNGPILSRSSSIIDTNDSQHFLEEMSKLGKSDKFYENLSKRICELQFQNLKTLSTCNTVIDPKSLALPPFPRSPLASPISHFPPTAGGIENFNLLKISPRGSTSGGDCSPVATPGWKTPSSPNPPPITISRKTSKSSMSSVDNPLSSLDIPDICVVGEVTETKVKRSSRHRSSHSQSCPGSVSPTDLGLNFPPTPVPSPPVLLAPLEFPESASIAEGTSLLSPQVTEPSSPQKNTSSTENSLISPKSPNLGSKRKLFLRSASPVPLDEDFLCVDSAADSAAFLFPSSDDPTAAEESTSPAFPVALCPTQFTSDGQEESLTSSDLPSEEEIKINAVIRENIAILQRLKLKSGAYLDGYDDEEEEDDDSYEEIEDDESGSGGRRSGSLGSEDRDSGVVPTSSKTFLVKDRLSSVSSNGSSRSGSRSGKRRCNGCGGRRLSRGNSIGSTCSAAPKSGGCGTTAGFGFNPFPTVRKARLRVTKYGLYN